MGVEIFYYAIAKQKMKIICPKCGTHDIRKNGHRRGKQNYQCKQCGRQFVEFYTEVGYSQEVKDKCLKMYVNGMGFRGIERVTNVNHNTVIRWVKVAGEEALKKNKV